MSVEEVIKDKPLVVASSLIKGMGDLANCTATPEDVKGWIKKKEFPHSPLVLELKKGGIDHNLPEITAFMDRCEEVINKDLPNMDIDTLKENYEIGLLIVGWLEGSRKSQLGDVSTIESACIVQEKRMKDLRTKIKARGDELKEADYLVVDGYIKEYIAKRLEEEGFNVDGEYYASFIAKKRSTQCTTQKGLNKKTTDDLEALIQQSLVEPRKLKAEAEARILEEQQKTQQQEQFGVLLEASKTEVDLVSFKSRVPDMYPLIVESAYRQIETKISKIKADAEALAKVAADALKTPPAEEAQKESPKSGDDVIPVGQAYVGKAFHPKAAIQSDADIDPAFKQAIGQAIEKADSSIPEGHPFEAIYDKADPEERAVLDYMLLVSNFASNNKPVGLDSFLQDVVDHIDGYLSIEMAVEVKAALEL